MSAAHTPGPWVIDWNVSRLDVFSSDASVLVASLRRSALSAEVDDAAKANARLIASAPDLLEAAKLMIAWFDAEEDHSKADFYQRMEMCRQAEDATRAAIAKATGGQS